VLALSTDTANYQFGFNPWARPHEHLGLEFEKESVKIQYSTFSALLRLGVVAYIGYLAWRHFSE